ncbi:hypothetical protein ACFZB9_13675 [Kitasatospora sp. NPDC008050]|uniref:hypothetical protein n=1 Tax=Kitasatospora sp. NPDC008050 TaxID=3364021 RepID=UPI0036EF65D8
MLLETVRVAPEEAPTEPRDCNVCRCLDIKADQAWCSDETGTYRNDSALTDVRVMRHQHREEGECSRPREVW